MTTVKTWLDEPLNEPAEPTASTRTLYTGLANAPRSELDEAIGQPENQALGLAKDVGQTAYDVTMSAVKGFNRGLATGVGSLVDLTNLAVGHPNPVGGTRWFLERYEQEGKIGGEKYPFISRVGEIPGTAAPFFGVTGAIARTAATGGKYGAPILEAFRKSPGYNALMELYSSSRAGVGYAIAKELFPESHTAEIVGVMAGGLIAPFTLVAAGARRSAGAAKRIVSSMTAKGVKRGAGEAAGKLAAIEPAVGARTLRMIRQGEMTPAEELGDIGLLRLQKAFERADPRIAEEAAARRLRAGEEIKQEFYDIAKTESGTAASYLEERVSFVTEKAQQLSDKAILAAKVELEKLPRGSSLRRQSIASREIVDKYYDQARRAESEIWDLVDGQAACNTTPMYELYNNMRKSGYFHGEGPDARFIPPLSKAEFDDMPEVIAKHLGLKAAKIQKYKDVEPLWQIKSFRTKLLGAHRREAAQDVPDRTILRILGHMERRTLDVMQASGAKGPLDEARAFSARLNDLFTEGAIGKIRGTARRGGPVVASEETLLHIIREGPRGAVRYDQLLAATDNDPELIKAVEDYIGRLFVKQATNNVDKIVPGRAEKFLRNFSDLLDKMPSLRKQLATTKSRQELAERVSAKMDARVKSVWDRRRSAAGLYLGASPRKRISAILASKNPTGMTKQITQQLRRDVDASKGWKAEWLDHIWMAGTESATKMERFFHANRKTLNEVFTADEQRNILALIDRGKRLEMSVAGGKSLNQILEETPDIALDFMQRIVGANLGAPFGKAAGASLVGAHAGSRGVRMITSQVPISRTKDVLAEAVMNNARMADILEIAPTGKEAEVFIRRMQSWMATLIPTEEE